MREPLSDIPKVGTRWVITRIRVRPLPVINTRSPGLAALAHLPNAIASIGHFLARLASSEFGRETDRVGVADSTCLRDGSGKSSGAGSCS